MATEFPTQQVLELACAAQRVNGSYLKEPHAVYSADGIYMGSKQTNKMLMLVTAHPPIWTADPKDKPAELEILPEDVALAEEIQQYFKRLIKTLATLLASQACMLETGHITKLKK